MEKEAGPSPQETKHPSAAVDDNQTPTKTSAPEVVADCDDDGDVKVRWNIRRTTSMPCCCFCQFMAVWTILIVLLLLMSTVLTPLTFSLDVPFYNRAEINQQREDAYTATQRDTDFVSALGLLGDGGKCFHDDPTVLTRNGSLLNGPAPTDTCQRASNNFLRLAFVAKDGVSNILIPERLRGIQEVEAHILNTIELTRYCYLIDSTYPALPTRNVADWVATIASTRDDDPEYVACERIFSVLNFLDPLYFDLENETGLGYYLLPNDQVKQEYDFDNLEEVIGYWSNFTVRTYNLSPFDLGETFDVQNLFWGVTSSEFTLGSEEAVGVTSTYALGLPINGYASSSEKAEDQNSETGSWLWNEFDSYLKSVRIDGVELYWNDAENAMTQAETGALALQSFVFFPLSIVIVLLYLMFMQDSLFIGFMGILQILLCLIPTIIFYSYVVGQDYFGVLHLIALYIILGIGVDNIFVFCDQFKHRSAEKRLDIRMQKTYNAASKTMFATSSTTFISFLSSSTSVFPAVGTFGLFAALSVLMNYLAVITFFPAVYTVYFVRVRKYWWDHPSLLVCCKKEVPGNDDEKVVLNVNGEKAEVDDDDHIGETETTKVDSEEEANGVGSRNVEGGSPLVAFFRDKWAPLMVKLRYALVVFFLIIMGLAIFTVSRLEPDENPPSTLPNGNNYKEYPDIMVKYFSRSGNPRAIVIRWVSGINPENPIDRSGTDETDANDVGTASFVNCSSYNPTTPAAQVWSLQTCHDLFFGNVSTFHGSQDVEFGSNGILGPVGRGMVDETISMNEFFYYSVVSCPMQGMRDWMLTDLGCASLQALSLPCFNETSSREGCTQWDDINGNSCEPFPAPEEAFGELLMDFLQDTSTDPNTQQTNFDAFKDQIFVGNQTAADEASADGFSCRVERDDGENRLLYSISTVATTTEDFARSFEDGIDLYDKWDAWSSQMLSNAPTEMNGTMQVSNGAWSFYFLNETLTAETFRSIGFAIALSFVVLTLIGGNIILALYAVLTIFLIVLDVMAVTVLLGWSLGVVEAVNYVVIIGMSIDYTVHMSEAYNSSKVGTRVGRVIHMLEEMGVSALSGALSTLLAVFPMFFAPNLFFVKFATFLFVTIALSCLYAMAFFPALLCIVGPQGNAGEVYVFFRSCCCKTKKEDGGEMKEDSDAGAAAAEDDDAVKVEGCEVESK